MFQSLKSTLAATFLFLTLTSVTHAQYSLILPDSYNYDSSTGNTDETFVENNKVTAGFTFDETTGTLFVTGSDFDDDCTVDIKSTYWIIVTLTTPGQTQYKYLYYSELKEIIFEGNAGDDSFAFTENAMDCMSYLKAVTNSFNLVCDLRGGQGLDYLSGGVDSDILSGGDDDQQDILIGGPGADLFINQREQHLISYYSSLTQSYNYYQYSVNEEYEMILDFNEYEGDLEIFADELEEALNPTPDDSTSEMDQDTTETSDTDSSPNYTTYKFSF